MEKSSKVWIVIILVLVLAVIGWWWRGGVSGRGSFGRAGDSYQAVFLTNNQVYFGKLADQDRAYVTLTDIFYLQVNQPLQPSQPNPNVSLVKLGNELHGPADWMEINRDQILFIENLRPDSQVVQGITKYKAEQKP